MSSRQYSIVDKEREYCLGPTKAMVRKEVTERVEVVKVNYFGGSYTAFEDRGTGKFELVPCDIKEVCK